MKSEATKAKVAKRSWRLDNGLRVPDELRDELKREASDLGISERKAREIVFAELTAAVEASFKATRGQMRTRIAAYYAEQAGRQQ